MVTKTIIHRMTGEIGFPKSDKNDPSQNPFSAILRHIDTMRKKSLLCDVTLLFDDGRRLSAHKIILAASSRFLKSRFSTAPGAVIRIHDVTCAVGAMLIDFAYTLQINLSKDNLDNVEAAAQKLGFLDVEDLCKKKRSSLAFQAAVTKKKKKSTKKPLNTVENDAETTTDPTVKPLAVSAFSEFSETSSGTSQHLETLTASAQNFQTTTTSSKNLVTTTISPNYFVNATTSPNNFVNTTSPNNFVNAPAIAQTVVTSSAPAITDISTETFAISLSSAQNEKSASSSTIHPNDESSVVFSMEASDLNETNLTILADELSHPAPASPSDGSATDLVSFKQMEVAVVKYEEDDGSKVDVEEEEEEEITKENAPMLRSDDARGIEAWRKAPANKKRLLCVHCQKTIYGSYYTFTAHASEVHGEKSNVCPYCDKKFTRKTYLKLHVENFHKGKNADEMVCSICRKQFLTKHTLKKHMRDIHENTEPYNCPHCPKAYRQESSLRDHVQLVHLSAPRFLCPDCNKGFMSMKDRDTHRRYVHLGQKAPRSACPECGKIFTEAHLRKHVAAVHKGLKLKCDECDLEFSGRAVLARHKEVVHAKRRYRCTLCLAEYRDFNAWKKHHQSQHIGVRFPCGHCERVFKSRNAMKRHAETAHRGVRYPCNLCDKTFTQKTMLSNHTKVVHMGEFPHPCSLCELGYSRPAHLKDHMLKVHHVVVDNGHGRGGGSGGGGGKGGGGVGGSEALEMGESVLEGFEGVTIADLQGGLVEEGVGGGLIELTNDASLDETTIITTIPDSDLATSLEAALGGSSAILIAAAPPDAPLPDGARIIQPSNIVFAADLPSTVTEGDVTTAVIYNGEVMTSNVGVMGTTSYFEFV